MKIRTFLPPFGYPLFLALAAALSLGGYLFWSQAFFRLGFPLDDAWIHQTYARNLARTGQWIYQSADLSAGSTSPLYTMLLSIGYHIRIDQYLWTYLLGWISLAAIACYSVAIIAKFEPINPLLSIGIGLFFIIEWHLVWAAGSGMETLLFTWVVLGMMFHTLKTSRNWLVIGLLTGLSIWIRPEGFTCLGPVGMAALVTPDGWRKRINALLLIAIGLGAMVSAYMVFNLLVGGNILPNTFFAKQAEYALILRDPIWKRISDQVKTFLVGSGLLLLPGFIFIQFHSFRKQQWLWLLWSMWVIGIIFMYAWRLPVTYQHGRYLIPAMVVFFVISWAGIIKIFRSLPSTEFAYRVIKKSSSAMIGIVSLAFWILGARAYSQDVAFIETEMIAAAKWISENTPPTATIAAHDIGAMGYFSNRRLIDLAGLITPQVIPFLNDQGKLRLYLADNDAEYLVTFPGWYPELIRCSNPVYETGGDFSRLIGGENMVVYAWLVSNGDPVTCQNR